MKADPKKDISLLVMPFDQLGDGKDTFYLGKGLYLDVLTELSRFRHFRILGHPGFGADDVQLSNRDFPEADYRVSGSFRQTGKRLVLHIQLFESRNQRLVWADRFQGTLASLLDLQEDLLGRLVAALQQQLDLDILAGVRRRPTSDLKAYEFWLRGLEELKKGTLESDEEARRFFSRAIEQDPEYSLAYSGMSLSFFNEWSCQLWDRWDISQKGAKEWAEKAIGLDEQNYLAYLVAGKVYLFERSFDMAEQYLRKALLLNPNDPFNLGHAAMGFVFLGHLEEAGELYQQCLNLDPFRADRYHPTGTLIHFEKGEYELALRLGEAYVTQAWVDFPAVLGAAHYLLGRSAEARAYWDTYLELFAGRISSSLDNLQGEALRWMREVNPYRHGTNLQPFWAHLADQPEPDQLPAEPKPAASRPANRFRFLDGRWHLSYQGKTAQMEDLKGLHDLQLLLQNPSREIHCTELMGIPVAESGTPVFDEQARRHYQERILDVQEAIQEAESSGQQARLENLHREYDQLLDHLSKATGLGGKTRTAGGNIEKARTAVTWRIRHAIRKMGEVHPALGKHFSNSVKTGVFCTYSPETNLFWDF